MALALLLKNLLPSSIYLRETTRVAGGAQAGDRELEMRSSRCVVLQLVCMYSILCSYVRRA